MSNFPYQFKKYDKEQCPACDHKKKWKRYIDITTGALLPAEYGQCERVNSCGHELNPYHDGYSKKIWEQERGNRPTDWKPRGKPMVKQPTPLPPPRVFIPNELKDASLRSYDRNEFVHYLHTLFDAHDVAKVVARYQVGSSCHWSGATVFWYIDLNGQIRAGQIKHFDQHGHTRKDHLADGSKKTRTDWVHSVLKYKKDAPDWLADYLNQENKISCLFGEHLLKHEASKTVALCESPKTAIIASLYFPQFIWVAVGALAYLTADRCKALAGRRVILWPDLNGFDLWQKKAIELGGGHWVVSDFLETHATEAQRKDGLDLADYLPSYDYRTFGKPYQPVSLHGLRCHYITANNFDKMKSYFEAQTSNGIALSKVYESLECEQENGPKWA